MEAAPAERETPADWGDGAVALSFRVKTSSRESGSQKASNVLEPDLRSHWSTGTNTKEWILLELQEPCLLSHIRIYNKSVLEWELTAGLRYKPDAFVKVRPRCEAPKRDMVYPGNHTPCRYVRISCLRGNPIAIFFIQLIGIPVPGLEPEFQPLVNYLLPQITSSKHPPSQNLHLQLLKDIASRLPPFLPQIEADINSLAENPESSVRFLALLAGPLYPIIYLVNERDPSKTSISSADSDRTNPAVTPTVSSNFEAQPRRLRSPSSVRPAAHLLAFQFETSVLLLRKALRDKTLGVVCLRASKVLQKLLQPEPLINKSIGGMLLNHNDDEIARCDSPSLILLTDYSSLFGEEFSISEIQFDGSFLNILDVAAVEEGILHVLYAAASQPMLCCKLAEITSDLWSVLPLVQALLPALRPPLSSGPIEQIDDSFNQWNHPTVHNALSQIVTMSVSSSVFHPLLRACAGYLSSYLSSHAKAACVLLDLCKGPLITWIPMIVAKIDFAVELVEDLLYVIQEAGRSLARSRAALKYFVLAISGHMDDVLTEYKEVMHKLLFILEMLDPFINPSTCVMKDTIRFGGISAIYMEKQTCAFEVALTIIRTAVKRAAVLPSLELEWRRGAVAPSVILSILDPHMPLPPDIDLCKSTVHENDHVSLAVLDYPAPQSSNPENIDGHDTSETIIRAESFEQCSSLFAPEELKQCELTRTALSENGHDGTTQTSSNQEIPESRLSNEKLSSNPFQLDNITAADYFDAQADYQQLINHQDCELRAHEFQRLALNLCMQQEPTLEGHNAGIDALLLAAECYVNPFFLLDCQLNLEPLKKIEHIHSELMQGNVSFQPKDLHLKDLDLVTIYNMENKRDKSVIDLLLQAARFDCEYHKKVPEGEPYPDTSEDDKQSIQISAEALQFADALTLVRKNQAMICHFIMKQFQRKEHSHSEILLQSLLFLLHSATDLFCRPEDIIDIILKSAENLNEQLSCLYSCINAGDRKLDRIKLHGLRRRWTLLQKLVLASSGSDNTRELVTIKRDGFRFRSLVPPSVWICKISDFFMFSCPLPRFLGWMAVSRYAKEYLNERLFLASDFSQLTSLLSIYMDELSLMDRAATQKTRPVKHELSNCSKLFLLKKETALSVKPNMATQFKILFPELHFFFPSMCSLFNAFGESILEAVGLQLKCLTNSAVQDVLCWFSEMCLWPYLERIKGHLLSANRVSYLRGNVAANAKAVVFYLLESIVVEHVEAIIPEMPRIVHILVSLCRASYTDVAFLNSVLCLVKPLISYYLKNRADAGKALGHASECSDFELLCFEELFEITQCSKLSEGTSGDKIQRPLLIFILGSMFSDFSFERRNKILGSILGWVDYLSSDPPSLLCNYLQSFQMLIDGCETVLVQNIEFLGIRILSVRSHSIESTDPLVVNKNNTQLFKKARDIKEDVLANFKKHIENGESHKIVYSLRPASIKDFCGTLEKFISHLTPSIEGSWKWHNQLASRLSLSIAKCLLFAKLLKSVLQEDIYSSSEQDIASKISSEVAQKHWESALEGLVEMIIVNQEKQCWQVASAMLDYIIKIQNILTWGNVLNSICSAVKHFCSHAPRISWRLQTEKWLPLLVSGGIEGFKNRETGLIDLFCIMLSHSEPEQRSFALQQLGRIINSASHTINDSKPPYDQNIIRSDSKVASLLVTHTWDRVAALAIHDSSMLLRNHAMALLTEFVPFVDTKHLQSFLGSSNSILNSMGQLSCVIEEGYMTRMSLLLLSKACLYSAPEDIALIPECVWRKMESMQTSTGGFSYMEKDLCRALCQLRSESDAKTDVEEVISGCTRQPISSDFKSIRESILQVLSSLSSLDAYFEFFSVRYDQEYQELEEAEIELELIEKEKADHDFSGHPHDDLVPDMPPYNKDDKRLQEIRENIRSLERSRLKEEITARRQKKLLIRHAREKYLEETRSREMELMQELDRERALEMEHEIERQRQLDIERAKSRELQFNLEMEKEKQTQRELQRELEQVELGRSSRREYSTNPNSRSRERYRERDGGRSQQEGSLRSSSRGHEGGGSSAQALAPAGSPGPTTVVLAGSRTFSGGNLLTILQPRERTADEDSAWAEGSRDSGDASSVGDPEFDGPRQHGPRASGSKSLSSRQLVERREREGAVRREGKWERKQHS